MSGRPTRPGPPPSIVDAEDRLVWIFGSSRSGSTWLLRMLASLDAVVPIDDPHLGHHLGVWRPISMAWATAEHPPDLTTLDRIKHDKDSYFFSDRYRAAWSPRCAASSSTGSTPRWPRRRRSPSRSSW